MKNSVIFGFVILGVVGLAIGAGYYKAANNIPDYEVAPRQNKYKSYGIEAPEENVFYGGGAMDASIDSLNHMNNALNDLTNETRYGGYEYSEPTIIEDGDYEENINE